MSDENTAFLAASIIEAVKGHQYAIGIGLAALGLMVFGAGIRIACAIDSLTSAIKGKR